MASWTCIVCTFINRNDANKCEICELDRTYQQSQPQSNTKNNLNSEDNHDNEQNDSSSNQTLHTTSDTRNNLKWECDRCTYLNNSDMKQCEMCLSDKSNNNITHSIENDYEFAKMLQQKYDAETENDSESESIEIMTPGSSNINSTSNTNSNSAIIPRTVSNSNVRNGIQKKRTRNQMEQSDQMDIKLTSVSRAKSKIKDMLVDNIILNISKNWNPEGTRMDPVSNGKIELQSSLLDTENGYSINSMITDDYPHYPGRSRQIVIKGNKQSQFPYFIIDLKDLKVLPTVFNMRRNFYDHSQYTGCWKNIVVQGSNDGKKWRDIQSFSRPYVRDNGWRDIGELRFKRRKTGDTYFSQFKIKLTAKNSSGEKVLKIQSFEMQGHVRRKVYQINRRNEIKDLIPFPKIPGNRCIGDINNVFNILNNWNKDGIQHKKYNKYNKPIKNLNVELHDYQKKGLSWLIDMEDNGNDRNIHGGLLCDEMGLGKTVQIIALMLLQKQKHSFKDRTIIITPLSLI
eukprot:157409_1